VPDGETAAPVDRSARAGDAPARRHPVILATLSVRFAATAERIAIDSAIEASGTLVVANMLALRSYPTTLMLAGLDAMTLPHEEDLDAVRATAARAARLGLRTELLRITTRRPVAALLELVAERRAGLLVFGPDPSRISGRRLRAARRRVSRDAPCLVWVGPDG
jgi:hypothetical protein